MKLTKKCEDRILVTLLIICCVFPFILKIAPVFLMKWAYKLFDLLGLYDWYDRLTEALGISNSSREMITKLGLGAVGLYIVFRRVYTQSKQEDEEVFSKPGKIIISILLLILAAVLVYGVLVISHIIHPG